MAAQWYYVEAGNRVGPVEDADFQGLVSSGKITQQTLVWRSGMPDWVAYGALPREGATVPVQAVLPIATQAETGSSGGGGNTPNREIMAQARAVLEGGWGPAIGICVVPFLIGMAVSMAVPFVGDIISFVIGAPLALGAVIYFLALVRGQDRRFPMLFDGFKQFGTALAAYFLMGLFTFLWLLLFIVPGIIASLAYSQTFYIIADGNGSIGPLEAIRNSKEMMRGFKWKYFCLGFRFLGWALLCIFTLGIGFLWLAPYMAASRAKFYTDIRGRA